MAGVGPGLRVKRSEEFALRDYGLTPGLWDLIGGTYGLSFTNRNAVAAAIEAPMALSRSSVDRALRSMVVAHPALRMSLTDPSSPEVCMQRIGSVSDTLDRILLVREEVEPERLQERMTELVAAMSEQFDVACGVTWGLVQLSSGAVDYIVFVFNHVVCDLLSASQFIRTFICSTASTCERPAPPDTYLDHLSCADVDSASPPEEEHSWWHARPWKEVDHVPSLAPVGCAAEPNVTTWSDVLDEGVVVTEHRLIAAIDQSLRDVTGICTTRIDSAVHGRGPRVTRTAGGWLSHAVPYVSPPTEGSSAVESTRAHAASWPSVFASVRRRPDLPRETQLRAHVFVNFFGSLDPRRWAHDGYRLSAVQPTFEPPGRSSLTPMRLKVHSVNRRWVATWSHSAGLADDGMSKEIADRTLRGLASAPAGPASAARCARGVREHAVRVRGRKGQTQ